MVPTDEQLLASIDAFLERHGMAVTRLGAEATGEPQLVSSIRGGRSPSLKVLQRLQNYMERKDDEAASDHVSDNTVPSATTSSGKPRDVSAARSAAA